MSSIELPGELESLLSRDATLRNRLGHVRDAVGKVLTANRLTFFPGYTDHGILHVNAVLRDMWKLVPGDVRSSNVLVPADAACICLAGMLHDLGMHVQPAGFLELISGRWTSPLTESRQKHYGDTEWPKLWENFLDEARRFDDRALTNLLGPRPDDAVDAEAAKRWGIRDPAEINKNLWDEYDRLVIGEFIRRHHPRLAHEIALNGFPGIGDKSPQTGFPPAAHWVDERLADIAGVVARSHGMSIRPAADDLKQTYSSRIRPADVLAPYHMALLRVADYLQIDTDRAPTVLLHLARPESPISLDEWAKHRVTLPPLWDTHDDPEVIQVDVEPKHELRTHLQLHGLLAGLQREMDHSAAVLSETYGSQRDLNLQRLRLNKTRAYHNLNHPNLLQKLPYIARDVKFTTASAAVLDLLVRPLYGNNPNIGIRELLQNAVDAVRELKAYLRRHPAERARYIIDENQPEVRVSIDQDASGAWWCEVRDRGIGMTEEIIVDYFLRAGASIRHSPTWTAEFANDKQAPAVLKTGRFGVGALAAFLLGKEIYVSTRRIGANSGFAFTATLTTDPIVVEKRDDLATGTAIRVPLDKNAVEALIEGTRRYNQYVPARDRKPSVPGVDWNWYVMQDVTLERTQGGRTLSIEPDPFPSPDGELGDKWRLTSSRDFPAVIWSPLENHRVACNGFMICEPRETNQLEALVMNFAHPSTCVMDPNGLYPLDITRLRAPLPGVFIPELVSDVYADVATFCLAAVDVSARAKSEKNRMPRVGYPSNSKGVTGDWEWGQISNEVTAAMMWMVSESGAAILDPGLIYALRLTRLAITDEPLMPVSGHIAFLCPAAANDPLLKTCEWLANEFAYGGKSHFTRALGRQNGIHDLVYADGKWEREFRSLEPGKRGYEAEYKQWRKQYPKAPALAVFELSQMVPMESDLSKVWMNLIGTPFVPFDAGERHAVVERLSPKYRDWFGKWQRHLRAAA